MFPKMSSSSQVPKEGIPVWKDLKIEGVKIENAGVQERNLGPKLANNGLQNKIIWNK